MPGRDKPDEEFDQDELEAGIKKEMAEHDVDRETAKRLTKDHLAEHAKSARSREYLEAFHEHARKQLPDWQSELIHQAALPASGGRGAAREPQHTAVEMQLLRRLTPEQLKDVEDKELEDMWVELVDYHKLATRRKLDDQVQHYERAGSFLAQEMHARGIEFDKHGVLGQGALLMGKGAVRASWLPEEIVLAPAAGLVREGDGLALRYHPMLGDGDLVEAALLDVGIHCKSSAPAIEEPGVRLLYDLVLRRPGVTRRYPISDDEAGLMELGARPRGLEPMAKADFEKRCIWYIMAEPGAKDTYDHAITREEVEDQAHRYMMGPRRVFMEHGEESGFNREGMFPRELTGKVITVESGLLPCDTDHWFGEPLPRTAPMGSWFTCNYHPDPEIWKFLSTHPHGASWRGFAAKVER